MPMLYKEFQKKMKQCPFCAGKNRVIVAYESAYITYALAPYHQHHLLVIPRRHVETFLHLNAEEDDEISGLLRFGVRALHALGYRDCTILVRDGMDSGKSVRHLHYHIVPHIHIGDVDHKGEQRRVLKKAEISAVVRDLKQIEKRLRQG